MALQTKYFVPQQDITAYELALIIMRLRLNVTLAKWETFSPEVQRHFTDHRPKE